MVSISLLVVYSCGSLDYYIPSTKDFAMHNQILVRIEGNIGHLTIYNLTQHLLFKNDQAGIMWSKKVLCCMNRIQNRL